MAPDHVHPEIQTGTVLVLSCAMGWSLRQDTNSTIPPNDTGGLDVVHGESRRVIGTQQWKAGQENLFMVVPLCFSSL